MKLNSLANCGSSYQTPEFGPRGNDIITGSVVTPVNLDEKKFQITITTAYDLSQHDDLPEHINLRLGVEEILGDYTARTESADSLKRIIKKQGWFKEIDHRPVFG